MRLLQGIIVLSGYCCTYEVKHKLPHMYFYAFRDYNHAKKNVIACCDSIIQLVSVVCIR